VGRRPKIHPLDKASELMSRPPKRSELADEPVGNPPNWNPYTYVDEDRIGVNRIVGFGPKAKLYPEAQRRDARSRIVDVPQPGNEEPALEAALGHAG